MPKYTRWLLDGCALLLCIVFGYATVYANRGAADPVWTAVQERGVLRVGTDPGFKPFAELRDGVFVGYDIELATEIARRLGVRVEFKQVVYDALYDVLQAGEVDMLAAALPIAPQQGWRARFSDAYLNAGQLLVTRTGSAIEDSDDLAGKRIGAGAGTEGDTWLRDRARTMPSLVVRSEYETSADALAALARGELDGVVADAVAALTAQAQYPHLEVAQALTFDPYVVAVPVDAYQLTSEINRALADMRADGYFDRANRRWFRTAESAP
jgi:ABC-type amino acid transport substrate-binding protein